jgi:Uma2 family endonuclease
MASQPEPKHAFKSVEEYFELERTTGKKYDYVDGQVYLMSGGSFNHSEISFNVETLMKNHLRGGSCRAYNSDVRVRITETKYLYPDVSVSCHPTDRGSGNIMEHPRVVVEVLSPSNTGYDLLRKIMLYRRVPTLQEILLVDSQQYYAEVHRRGQNHFWATHLFYPGGGVELTSLSMTFPLEAAYENVEFTLEEAE